MNNIKWISVIYRENIKSDSLNSILEDFNSALNTECEHGFVAPFVYSPEYVESIKYFVPEDGNKNYVEIHIEWTEEKFYSWVNNELIKDLRHMESSLLEELRSKGFTIDRFVTKEDFINDPFMKLMEEFVKPNFNLVESILE